MKKADRHQPGPRDKRPALRKSHRLAYVARIAALASPSAAGMNRHTEKRPANPAPRTSHYSQSKKDLIDALNNCSRRSSHFDDRGWSCTIIRSSMAQLRNGDGGEAPSRSDRAKPKTRFQTDSGTATPKREDPPESARNRVCENPFAKRETRPPNTRPLRPANGGLVVIPESRD